MVRTRKAGTAEDVKFLLRLPPTTMEMMRHFAGRHRRTVTAEMETALNLYVADAMLHALDDPEFVEVIAASRADFDADDFRAQTERDLQAMRDRAFPRPPSYEQFAGVLSQRKAAV